MTLSEVLKKYDNRDFSVIEYRSSEKDILVGMAAYKNKMLVSLDGDSYHLNDEIERYTLYKNDWLVVWEKIMWKKGIK